MKVFHVKVRQHRDIGHSVVAFEELRMQIHRKLAQFLAREERFLDFLFGRLLRVDQPLRRIVAFARLQVIMPARFPSVTFSA